MYGFIFRFSGEKMKDAFPRFNMPNFMKNIALFYFVLLVLCHSHHAQMLKIFCKLVHMFVHQGRWILHEM
jgi:hypothetical protein